MPVAISRFECIKQTVTEVFDTNGATDLKQFESLFASGDHSDDRFSSSLVRNHTQQKTPEAASDASGSEEGQLEVDPQMRQPQCHTSSASAITGSSCSSITTAPEATQHERKTRR